MKSVPQELRERLQKVAPPEAEVIPLQWAFEQEDYNIAVVMPDTIDPWPFDNSKTVSWMS